MAWDSPKNKLIIESISMDMTYAIHPNQMAQTMIYVKLSTNLQLKYELN